MESVLTGPMGRTLLGSSEVTIGCDADNTLVVADLRTAAHHALVRPDGLGYAIIDLGSEYGTIVNGRWLEPHKARPLLPGDIIQIGTTTFTFEVFQNLAAIPVGALGVGVGDVGRGETGQGNTPFSDVASYDTANFSKLPDASPHAAPVASFASPSRTLKVSLSSLRSRLDQARQEQPYTPQPWVSGGTTTYPPQQQLWHHDRRRLYLALAVMLAIIVISALIALLIPRSSPDKTLDTFCSALLAGNGQLAVSQFSARLQNQQGAIFATVFSQRKASICTHTPAQTSGSSANALLTVRFPDAVTPGFQSSTLVMLIQDAGGAWKIDSLQGQ